MPIPAMPFIWDGEALWPRRKAFADQHLVIGETYLMAEVLERSSKSHDHEFAWLNEAWKSLPEDLADTYPTPDHLRKRALILSGYYDETAVDAGTRAAALRVAAFMESKDEFAMVVVRGPYAVMRTAKSQSRRAMDRKTFQESKTKVMEIVAGLLGVPSDTLAKQSEAA